MIIMGVDPGTQVTGYGVIRQTSRSWEPLDFGCIRPPRGKKNHEKYLVIFESIDSLLEKYQPQTLVLETPFVYKNVKSALYLGRAGAAVLIAAAKRGVDVVEYTPRKAKQAIVGNGAASKFQVQKMIQMQLQLPTLPEPADAADALALALCHAHARRLHV
jgi:crossover junction endodeoxyribonuclease RuvC